MPKEISTAEMLEHMFCPCKNLQCPISCEDFADPVTADDGRTYERIHIQQWIDACQREGKSITSPWTRAVISSNLRENPELKKICEYRRSSAYLEKKKILLQEVKLDGLALSKFEPVLTRDQEIVKTAVMQQGLALRYAHSDLQKDEEIALLAVRQNPLALQFARRHTKTMVLEAIRRNSSVFQFADTKFQQDEEVVLEAVKADGNNLEYASSEMKANEKVVQHAFENNVFSLRHACDNLKDKKRFLSILEEDGNFLQYASEDLKQDVEVVCAALKQDAKAIQYVSPLLTSNKDFVCTAASLNGLILEFLSKRQRKDNEIVTIAVENNAEAFQFAHENLANDKNFIMNAVKKNGGVLGFVAEQFTKDWDVVTEAIKVQPLAIRYASKELRNEAPIALLAVQGDCFALQYLSDRMKNDKRIVRCAVMQRGCALEFASAELQQNKDIAIEAVQNDGLALQYISNSTFSDNVREQASVNNLSDDEDVVLAAVQNNGMALQFASNRLKATKNVALAAVNHNSQAVQHVSGRLLKEKDIFLSSLKKDASAFAYVPNELAEDWDVALAACHHEIKVLQNLTCKNLIQNKQFILNAVKLNPLAFIYAAEPLKRDLEIITETFAQGGDDIEQCVFEAVQHNGMSLQFASEALKKEKHIVKAAVQQNPLSLKYAAVHLNRDWEIISLALRKNHEAFQYTCSSLRASKESVLKILDVNSSVLPLLPTEFQGDKAIVLEAVKKNAQVLEYAFPIFRDDREVVLQGVEQDGMSFQWASDRLKADRQLALIAIRKNGLAFQYVLGPLRDDQQIQFEAIKENIMALQYISHCSIPAESFSKDLLKNEFYATMALTKFQHLGADKTFMEVAVQFSGRALKYASDELRNDKDFLRISLQETGIALQYVSDSLRNDEELVLAAVTNDGTALQFASQTLQSSRKVVLAAVKSCGTAFQYASTSLRQDRDIALNAVRQNKKALKWVEGALQDDEKIVVSALTADLDFMLYAVTKNGLLLEFAVDQLKQNVNLVLKAVTQNGMALKYAPLFQNNKKVVTEATKSNSDALLFAAKSLLESKEFFISLFKNRLAVLRYAPEQLKVDEELVAHAVSQNGLELEHAGEYLKTRYEIIKKAVNQNGLALQFADEKSKADWITKLAVKQNGMALQFATGDQKGDLSVVNLALENQGESIRFVSEKIRHDLVKSSKKFTHKQEIPKNAANRKVNQQKWEDDDFIRCAVEHDGLFLEYLPMFQNNANIVSIAVKQNGLALQFASPHQMNKDLLMAAIHTNVLAYQYADEQLKNNQDLLADAIKLGLPSEWVPKNFTIDSKKFSDFEGLKVIFQGDGMFLGPFFDHVQNSFSRDSIRELSMFAVNQNGMALQYCTEEMKADYEIVLAALQSNSKAVLFADARWQEDLGYHTVDDFDESELKSVLGLIKHGGQNLDNAPRKFKRSFLVCLLAVQNDGLALKYADDTLKDCKEIVLEAVKQNGLALQYASDALRRDKELDMQAVRNNGYAWQFISEDSMGDYNILSCASDFIKRNKALMLAAVKRNAYLYKLVSDSLKNDKELALLAVSQLGSNLEYVGPDLKADHEIVESAIRNDGSAIKYVPECVKIDDCLLLTILKKSPELKSNFDFWNIAVKYNGMLLQLASAAIKRDKAVVIKATSNNYLALKHADKALYDDMDLLKLAGKLRDDSSFMKDVVSLNGLRLDLCTAQVKECKDVVLAAVEQNGFAIQYAPLGLMMDYDVALAAVKNKGPALEFLPDSMKNNEILTRVAVCEDAMSVKFAAEKFQRDLNIIQIALMSKNAEELKRDRDFWRRICNLNGLLLQEAPFEIQEDVRIVRSAVIQNGNSLQYASPKLWFQDDLLQKASSNLKESKNFMMNVVRQAGLALKYASDNLKNDQDLVMEAVKSMGASLQYASQSCCDNENIVLSALENFPLAFSMSSSRLKAFREFVLLAVSKNGLVLEYVTDKFQNDREIVNAAVQQNGLSLKHAGLQLKDDYEIVKNAVMSTGEALQFASIACMGNKKIVTYALQRNIDSLRFASEDLLCDRNFILSAVRINGMALSHAQCKLKGDRFLVSEACNNFSKAIVYCMIPAGLQESLDSFIKESCTFCKASEEFEDVDTSEILCQSNPLESLVVIDFREWKLVEDSNDDPQKIPEGLRKILRAGMFDENKTEEQTSRPGTIGLYDLFPIVWNYGYHDPESPPYPCSLTFLKLLKTKNPAIICARVNEGILYKGTTLVAVDVPVSGSADDQLYANSITLVGKVIRIEVNGASVDMCDAETGLVGIELDGVGNCQQLKENGTMVTLMDREGIEALKWKNKKSDHKVPIRHWKLVMKIVKILDIPKSSNLCLLLYIDLESENSQQERTVLKLWKIFRNFHPSDLEYEREEFSRSFVTNYQMANIQIWDIRRHVDGRYHPKQKRGFSVKIDGITITKSTPVDLILKHCSECVTQIGVSLSEEQQRIVKYNDSVFVQGRSGTGKTLVMLIKIMIEQVRALASESRPRRILFVSKSSRLCEWVGKELKKMSVKLDGKLDEKVDLFPAESRSWKELCNHLASVLNTEQVSTDYVISYEYFESQFWSTKTPKKPASYMDPKLVWAEINTYIKGSNPHLSESEYIHLFSANEEVSGSSSNGIVLTIAERGHIYQTYKLYEDFRNCRSPFHKRTIQWSDEVDIANDLLCKYLQASDSSKDSEMLHYDMIFVDEVQDFVPAQLNLILHLCKNVDSFCFGGDTCQTINVGCSFSFRDLQNLFKKVKQSDSPVVEHLTENFRSLSGIVNFGNRLVRLMRETFPKGFDELRGSDGYPKEESFVSDGDPVMILKVLDQKHENYKAAEAKKILKKIAEKEGVKFEPGEAGELVDLYHSLAKKHFHGEKFEFDPDISFVIVRDFRARTCAKLILNAVILTPLEAKGLETRDVAVLNFFSSKNSGYHWGIARRGHGIASGTHGILSKSIEGAEFEKKERIALHSIAQSLHEIKTLYVSVTRARQRCTLIQNETSFHKSKPLIEYCEDNLKYFDFVEDIKLFSDHDHVHSETKYDKAVRLNHLGNDLFSQASDDEPKNWNLHSEAMVCFKKAEKYLIESEDGAQDVDNHFHSRLRLLKLVQRSFSRAKSCYLRCQALYLELHDNFSSAAFEYLAVNELKLAAECFRLYGQTTNNQAGYRSSAMCLLIKKQWQAALGVLLDGGLFFEAALCVEESCIIAEFQKSSFCREDSEFVHLKNRYLSLFAVTCLLVKSLMEQNLSKGFILKMIVDCISLLTLFPETSLLMKMLKGTGQGSMSDFLTNVRRRDKRLLTMFGDDASILSNMDVAHVKKDRRFWVGAVFSGIYTTSCDYPVDHNECSAAQKLDQAGSFITFLDIVWSACNSEDSILRGEFLSVCQDAIKPWLDSFSLQYALNSSCKREVFFTVLNSFCNFFVSKLLEQPDCISVVAQIFSCDLAGRRLTAWLLVHLMERLQISVLSFFSHDRQDQSQSFRDLPNKIKEFSEVLRSTVTYDDINFVKETLGYSIQLESSSSCIQ